MVTLPQATNLFAVNNSNNNMPMYIPFHIPQPPEDTPYFDDDQWGEVVSMNTVL